MAYVQGYTDLGLYRLDLKTNTRKEKRMAKFKQVPQAFIFKTLIKFWRNMVKNYNEDVYEDDFFDIVANSFNHDKAIELIEAAYTEKELHSMKSVCYRRGQLDFSDPLDNVFTVLWNNERLRGKCRAVLGAVYDSMLSECKKVKDDPLRRGSRGTLCPEESRARRLQDGPSGNVLPRGRADKS